jgi:hypothetical protein
VVVACAVHDLLTESIPPRLLVPLALFVTAECWLFGVGWWWGSAWLGLLAFVWARLPWGDRLAIFLSLGLWPLPWAIAVLVCCQLAAVVMILGVGRWRSMIGVPYFPLVALSHYVVVCAWLSI